MKLHPDQMGHTHAVRERSRSLPTIAPRLRPVLLLVAQGMTNREIAQRHCLSQKTVKNYLHELFRFFDVMDRLSLVLAAMRSGAVPCVCGSRHGHPPPRKPRPRRNRCLM